MENNQQRRVSLSTAAIAVIVTAMLATALGYYLGSVQTEGTYTIRGDTGAPIIGRPVDERPAIAQPPPETDGRVNVNTATFEELQALPGIGPAMAQRIIDFRESYGPFVSAEDLLHVSGIGETRLANMYDMITW